MNSLLENGLSDPEKTEVLVALNKRVIRKQELAGFVATVRREMIPFPLEITGALDICGTGGDKTGSFNISTTAAFVIAGANVTVVKHSNRAASGRSGTGSADVLDALGVDLSMSLGGLRAAIGSIGIGILYAPRFHPRLAGIASLRRSLGVPTIFNMIGPLVNPAPVQFHCIGVSSIPALQVMADVVQEETEKSDVRFAFVHGTSGTDEISLAEPTIVAEIQAGRQKSYRLTHSDFGLPKNSSESLRLENSFLARQAVFDVLSGKKGPKRDVVLANAGLALKFVGKTETLREGVLLAAQSVDSGAAMRKLEWLRAL